MKDFEASYSRSSTLSDRRPSDVIDNPIPQDAGKVNGWKDIPLRSRLWRRDSLVPLGIFSDFSDIFTSSVYFGEHSSSPYREQDVEGETLITQFVRRSTALKLRKAQRLLPEDHFLLVFDAYRSKTVQGSLYDTYLKELRNLNPDMSETQLSEETQKYVSLPSSNKRAPAPHNTGGVVDVAIVKLDADAAKRVHHIDAVLGSMGKPGGDMAYTFEMERAALMRQAELLDFGTSFDDMSSEAALRAMEGEGGEVERSRRMLFNVMKEAGFSGYEHEWWHYNDIATQMGARAAGLTVATMGAATPSRANMRHEKMRRDHYMGTNIINDNLDGLLSRGDLPKHVALVAITQATHGGVIDTPRIPAAIRVAPSREG